MNVGPATNLPEPTELNGLTMLSTTKILTATAQSHVYSNVYSIATPLILLRIIGNVNLMSTLLTLFIIQGPKNSYFSHHKDILNSF